MDKKVKLLYYGDSPTATTGFGKVAKEILLRLKETGKYEIVCLGINYYGDPTPLDGVLPIYPCQQDDLYGKNKLYGLLEGFAPDIFFTLNDYDALNFVPAYYTQACKSLGKNIKWVYYFPVDGRPFHPEYVTYMQKFVDYPVTITKFGQDAIKEANPDFEVPYIYHGVDTVQFHPLSKEDKKKNKKRFGLEDKFVFLSIGTNQIRKNFSFLMQAFSQFSQDKDDVALYLHTMPQTNIGWDLIRLSRNLNIVEKFYYTKDIQGPFGVPDSNMNYIYNLADVYVTPHLGEGFGLPQLEAMSAGVPVISHNITATKELLPDEFFYPVETEKVKNYYGGDIDLNIYFPFGDRGLYRPYPSISSLVEQMEKVYRNRIQAKKKGSAGRQYVVNNNNFKWDNIALKFDTIFDDLMSPVSDEDFDDLDVEVVV